MNLHLERMRYVHHKNTFYKHIHTHDFCELAYYTGGHGVLSQNGTSYKYSEGTIHIVPDGILHDESNEAESRIILLYFSMPKDFLAPGIYSDKTGEILSLLRRLRIEMSENKAYKEEMADAILMQLLLTLKRTLFPTVTDNKNFNHIVQYIDENFQSEIDMHEIAKKSFLSYDRFRHIFKEHTGLAPHDYINNKRIELAKLLIEIDPDIPLGFLSSECGYVNQAVFSNVFRAKTNMPPSQYKKKYLEKRQGETS